MNDKEADKVNFCILQSLQVKKMKFKTYKNSRTHTLQKMWEQKTPGTFSISY